MRCGSLNAKRVGLRLVRAYTLVEILIVVLVLAIAAAIVVPNIGSAADSQAISAARVIQSSLEGARSMALSKQQPHSVVFSPDLQSFKVVMNYTGGAYSTLTAVAHPVDVGKPFEITLASLSGMNSARVTAAAFNGQPYVTFQSLGDATAAGSVTVCAGTTTLVISVEALTGCVTVARTAG